MDVNVFQAGEAAVAHVASAIGEPARARILFCLLDGRARTSTELAAVAELSPSTVSMHLRRLEVARLVNALRQGKHRYYSLGGTDVAAMLERLSVLAGGARNGFMPTTPQHLRTARSCYDHMAGSIGVALHDRFKALGWLIASQDPGESPYDVSAAGAKGFGALGVDLAAARAMRRRFACGCLDWSERRLHLGGALGAALFTVARSRKWVRPNLDSRALRITDFGRREILGRLGIAV
jgi:DNA-binding transcriptional ArsR family regulator